MIPLINVRPSLCFTIFVYVFVFVFVFVFVLHTITTWSFGSPFKKATESEDDCTLILLNHLIIERLGAYDDVNTNRCRFGNLEADAKAEWKSDQNDDPGHGR